MKYMAEQGLIATETDKRSGKKVYSIQKWFEARNSRFVEFYIGKLAVKDEDAANDAAIDESEPTEAELAQATIGGFTDIEDGSEELPF